MATTNSGFFFFVLLFISMLLSCGIAQAPFPSAASPEAEAPTEQPPVDEAQPPLAFSPSSEPVEAPAASSPSESTTIQPPSPPPDAFLVEPPPPTPSPFSAPSPSPSPSSSPSPSPSPAEEPLPPPPSAAADSPASFCTRAVMRKTCPNPPTFDFIQLQDYAGKWYEIGATASSKLVSEAGSICNQAMYTVPNATSFAQAPNMSVTNTGLHVAGPLTSLGVQQVAAAAASACAGARSVCDKIANESRTTKAAVELASVAATIEQADFAADLLQLQNRIFNAMGEIDATLDLFSPCMESIQRLDGELSQAELLVNTSTVQERNATIQAQAARLQALTGLLDQANALVDSLKQSVRKMTECTPKIVNISAQLLFVGDLESSVRLTTASTDISTSGDAILTQALGIRLTLKGVAAARGLMDLATTGSSTPNMTNSSTGPRFDTSAGFAIQNLTSPGKLQLQLTPSITSPVPAPSAPYWVLSLRGRAMQGYRASLVYSCSHNDVTGTIHQGMFILSRTPSLPQKIVDDLLQLATAFGINTDCEDPFVYTVHHGKTCAIPRV